jgi:hypothetical protein
MECDVCLIEWDAAVHIPRILSCGHTICEACLISMFRKAKSKESEMFCPSCMKKQKHINEENDIKNLIKNINLLRITEKIESRKTSMFQSFLTNRDNLNISMFSKTGGGLNSSRMINDKSYIFSTNELICKTHCLQVHSYALGTNLYLCDLCLKDTNLKTFPLPNYIREVKRKMDSAEIKASLIGNEIERLQEFFKSYQDEFEKSNMTKVDELFDYLNKLIKYNYTTAKTVVQQCKKEQDIQIDLKLKELQQLLDDLNEVKNKIKFYTQNENDEKLLVKCNEELNDLYYKIQNFLNYDMDLSLFQMKIGIKENIKDNLFEFVQNAYYVDVDFASVKGETPTLKHILQKDKFWQCPCGEIENSVTDQRCTSCHIFRKVESYENITSNPMYTTKEEIQSLSLRRKQEVEEFQQIYKNENKGSNINKDSSIIQFYALDLEWFLLWKCFVTNDVTDKYISNSKKRICPNKSVGVLPPGPISNSNLFEKGTKEFNWKSLRKGLKKNDDYIIINVTLWNFFYRNYNSTFEITLKDSLDIYSSMINCQIVKLSYDNLNKKEEGFIEDNNKVEKFNEQVDFSQIEKNIENVDIFKEESRYDSPDISMTNENNGNLINHEPNEMNTNRGDIENDDLFNDKWDLNNTSRYIYLYF